jgi:uncharacterized protein
MKNTIFACLWLMAASNLRAQTDLLAADRALLGRAFAPPTKDRLRDRYAETRQNPNELQFILSGFFLGYKTFVSSQDQSRCNFSPSCSEYGLLAVKKYGIIRGGISTFDRLTRCNGLTPAKYQKDFKNRLLIDPIQW